MLQLLFIFAMIFYLISIFISSTIVQFIVSILSILIIVIGFFKTNRIVKLLGLAFLTTGLILLISYRASLSEFFYSFGLMLNLLTLFALLPILGIPIRLGNYANQIKGIVNHRVKSPEKMYVMTSGVSYVLSFFMNIATLPIAYYAIRPSANLFNIKNKNKFITRPILQGFTMPLLWAPTAPIVIAVLALNKISWTEMLLYLIPLSIAGFVLNCLLGIRSLKKEMNNAIVNHSHEQDQNEYQSDFQKDGGSITTVILAIILFFCIIFLAEILSTMEILFIVTITVIPFSFLWALLIRKGKQFLGQIQQHFSSGILTLTDQFYIFLAAGFLIETTRLTGADEVIRIMVGNISQMMGSAVFVTVLPLIPLAFAFLGMHPIISLSLMAEALNADLLGVSNVVLTIAMTSGAVTAFLMGPYNATIGLMSTIVDENPYVISRWNVQFTFGFLLIVMCVLIGLQLFFIR